MVRKFCVCVLRLLSIYVPEEAHKYRVREVWSAREMAVARAAVGVGRVWQARERTLEVEEKDAVPFRRVAREKFKSELRHGPRHENDDEGDKKYARYVHVKRGRWLLSSPSPRSPVTSHSRYCVFWRGPGGLEAINCSCF